MQKQLPRNPWQLLQVTGLIPFVRPDSGRGLFPYSSNFKRFFAIIQNKLHYVIHHHTVASHRELWSHSGFKAYEDVEEEDGEWRIGEKRCGSRMV